MCVLVTYHPTIYYDFWLCFVFYKAAVSMLKQEYKEEEMALKDALKLAVKVLDKTLDITKLTPDKG